MSCIDYMDAVDTQTMVRHEWIVSGYREFEDYDLLAATLDRHVATGDVIVHGDARGADTLAGRYADERGLQCQVHPADWDRHGPRAGLIRNRAMLNAHPEARVIAFLAKQSRGTRDMVRAAREAGRTGYIVHI